MERYIGIDIGSTTVKVVVLDENNNILYKHYGRHFAKVREATTELINGLEGMLKGKVLSSIFKGVHYELEVKGNETTWIIHSTKTYPVGSMIGLDIHPEDIHIMRKEVG